ncbi:MAG: leucine-rich repeat domain-containing protein, partial [Clostridia bacterium]|nr:leucine-rich repeat domain-containing protein [Clostridia bacterium]
MDNQNNEFTGTANEQASLEGLYNRALAEMEAAATEDEYQRAAIRFSGLRGYKDAQALESKCLLRIEKLKNDALLNSAKYQMKSDTAAGYREALIFLRQVKNRLETGELILTCEKKLKLIEEEEKLRRKRIRSWLLTAASIVAAVALVVGVYFILPKPELNYERVDGGVIVSSINEKWGQRSIEIPSEVNGRPVIGIAESAFEGSKLLQSVLIPSSVKSIGERAFYGCKALYKVVLPEGLTEIAESTFEGCEALKIVVMPASVVSIGNAAFRQCRSLAEIEFHEGLKTIGDGAFAACPSISSLTFPESLESIGANAFSYCIWLSEITTFGGTVSIGDEAFEKCQFLKSARGLEGVKSIGARAFEFCTLLSEVSLPEGLEKIGDSAFAHCVSLKTITIPSSVDTIASGLFKACNSLEKFVIPEGVTEIGERAFAYCALTELVIPSSVTHIDSYAFLGCDNLKSVTALEGLKRISNSAFADCVSLDTLILPASVQSIRESAFKNCRLLFNVNYAGSISDWKKFRGKKFHNTNTFVLCTDGTVCADSRTTYYG